LAFKPDLLTEDGCEDKIEDNGENQYAIHDQVDPDVRLIFIIEFP
jgi:hypothetical protein